jgi:hypothetical protein
MKATHIRKLLLAGVIALVTAGAATPAHATLSGSNPRPTASVMSTSEYISVILTVLGF